MRLGLRSMRSVRSLRVAGDDVQWTHGGRTVHVGATVAGAEEASAYLQIGSLSVQDPVPLALRMQLCIDTLKTVPSRGVTAS